DGAPRVGVWGARPRGVKASGPSGVASTEAAGEAARDGALSRPRLRRRSPTPRRRHGWTRRGRGLGRDGGSAAVRDDGNPQAEGSDPSFSFLRKSIRRWVNSGGMSSTGRLLAMCTVPRYVFTNLQQGGQSS